MENKIINIRMVAAVANFTLTPRAMQSAVTCIRILRLI